MEQITEFWNGTIKHDDLKDTIKHDAWIAQVEKIIDGKGYHLQQYSRQKLNKHQGESAVKRSIKEDVKLIVKKIDNLDKSGLIIEVILLIKIFITFRHLILSKM